MKISEFLKECLSFTSFGRQTRAKSRWVIIPGVCGPAIVYAASGRNWRKDGRIFDPLQAVLAGWDAVHDPNQWTIRPNQAEILEGLGLTEEQYQKIEDAASNAPGHNKALRQDLLRACGIKEPTC